MSKPLSLTEPASRLRLTRRAALIGAGSLLAAPTLVRAAPGQAITEKRSSVEQHGVTFVFDRPVPVGRYVTGDWFAVGPVTILAIKPESRETGEREWSWRGDRETRVIHGAQLDYNVANRNGNGLEGGLDFGERAYDGHYVHDLNVDPGATGRPLRVESPATIIKAVSLPGADVGTNGRPLVGDLVMLTVVNEVPPENAFRPSAEPGDKRSLWTPADMRFDLLPALPRPLNAPYPRYDRILRRMRRVQWNQTGRYDRSRRMMAANNQESYGRDESKAYADALLALCLNAPMRHKRLIAPACVQQGLDIAALLGAGASVKAADGNSVGRKAMLAFAATMLDDPDLKRLSDGSETTRISEDAQTFYVGAADVETPRHSWDRDRGPYTKSMIGIPEFGGQHLTPMGTRMAPERSGSHWDMSYRSIFTRSTRPAALAALCIPGMAQIWNRAAFFDYHDRAAAISGGGGSGEHGLYWREWRELAERPVFKARPEPMNFHREDRTLQIARTIGAPVMRPVESGVEVHLVMNPNRDRSLDATARYDLRISLDGENWQERTDLPADAFPARVTGLPSGKRVYVQLRQVHPEHGHGPWSFDWWWYRNEWVYDGRVEAADGSWSVVKDLGNAVAAIRWASAQRKAGRKAELRGFWPQRDRRTGWKKPTWLDLGSPPEIPENIRPNTAYAPSMVTL